MGVIVLLLGFGVALLVIGMVMLRTSRKMKREGTPAQGTVVRVDMEVTRGGDNTSQTSYTPVFEFLSEEGSRHVVKSRRGVSSSKTFVVGQPVPVLYLPVTPEKAVINEGSLMWVGPVIFTVAGCLLTIGGIAFAALR